ncbi:MAG: transcriptional regulator [Pedobacter sp.]|nr:MAG: transcriptional regulator [Pedobacter sp.]
MKEVNPRSECPVSYTLDFFGDKWSLLIMRDILLHEKSTYSEFLNSAEKIATNILADRLSMLESHGFVTKKVATDKKSKFVYYPTEKSIALLPILLEIGAWGSQFRSTPDVMALVKAFKKDKAATIKRLQQKLKSNIKALSRAS